MSDDPYLDALDLLAQAIAALKEAGADDAEILETVRGML